MVWPIVCGVFAALIAFVLTLRIMMGDDGETRELKARLRFHGVEPRAFSNTCLTELIEIETRHLRLAVKPTDKALHAAIDYVAVTVRNICQGTKFFSLAELLAEAEGGEMNPYWAILRKHHPARFAPDHLAETQAFNQAYTAPSPSTIRPVRRDRTS